MWWLLAAALTAADADATVTVERRAVLVATIGVTCAECDWSAAGREAVMLRLSLDGGYSQHLPTVRPGDATYQVLLGTVERGTHQIRVTVDEQRSSAALRSATAVALRIVNIEAILEGDARFPALAHAPFVYERANTVGRFSDVPVFAYYQIEPTDRGTRYRYSVIFTNEDGGTPADRLMATWGRTTDIEYIYSVEIDRNGAVVAHDYQGPDHEVLIYRAGLEQQHARLWVVTDNNMVLDRGTTTVRFAPLPLHFELRNVSREAVMDAHPWLYAVASQELAREGKIVAGAPPGRGTIPDPREFVYLEGCGEVGANAITFSVNVGDTWLSSDRGVPEYRIVRDGCFRAAIPLPAGAAGTDVKAVRVQAHPRAGKPASGPVRLTDVTKMFTLDGRYVPGPALVHWRGSVDLTAGGSPFEIPAK